MPRKPADETPPPYSAVIASPVGAIGIRVAQGCLERIDFLFDGGRRQPPRDPLSIAVATQLDAYFERSEWRFDLPLRERGTPFQRRVWEALRGIPSGATRTYGELARQLGSGARAVGAACRANPIVIVTPCHRIVAADGGPGGFAGATDGPPVAGKRWLLRHELPPAGP